MNLESSIAKFNTSLGNKIAKHKIYITVHRYGNIWNV